MPEERRAFSVAVFVRHAERVLLIRHNRLGTWLPIGGEMEEGETPLEAARRELREETGFVDATFPRVDAIDGAPLGLLGYEEHMAGSKGLHMNFAFVADVASDAVTPNGEYSEWRWVTLGDGPWHDAPPNVRQLAERALRAPR